MVDATEGRPRGSSSLLRLYQPASSVADRLETLLRAVALTRMSDRTELLNAALALGLRSTRYDGALAALQAGSDEPLLITATAGSENRGLGTVLRGEEAQVLWCSLRSRQPGHQLVKPDGRPVPSSGDLPYASWLCLPLITAYGRRLGALVFHSSRPMLPLAPEDVETLNTSAAQLAVNIENLQLHDNLERTLDELLTLYGAGQAISSSLQLDRVLAAILDLSRRIARAECCLISSADDKGELEVLATTGETPEWLSYRATRGVRLTLNAVLRDGVTRPLGIPPVAGWCTALKVRAQTIGLLEIYARGRTHRYDESHLLAGLATQAAIAMENAKLYRALRGNEQRLQRLVETMIQTQEDERRRAAYDIHDGVAQTIVSAHQHLQTYEALLAAGNEEAEGALGRGLDLLQNAIIETRKVISGLRPSALDDFGLVMALQHYLQAMREDFDLEVELRETLSLDRLPAVIETTVYRIVQQALTNVRQHAGIVPCRVRLDRRRAELILEVRDWGSGFDVDATLNDVSASSETDGVANPGRRMGLHGMRERANFLGGTIEITSVIGEGTVVLVSIPLGDSKPSRSLLEQAPYAE